MNKKGDSLTIFIQIGIAVMAFIALVNVLPTLMDEIETTRGGDNLDCDNSSISAGQRSACTGVDFSIFTFAMVGFGVVFAVLGGRFLFVRRTRE